VPGAHAIPESGDSGDSGDSGESKEWPLSRVEWQFKITVLRGLFMTIRSLMWVRVVAVVATMAVLALDAAPASAQKKKAATPEEQERAQKDKDAREHYEKGITHYNLGEFDQAIAEFKQAYAISGAPGLLFNIAQAYRLQGDYKQALYFYKTYLRLLPDAVNRADVEQRIAEMEKLMADQAKIDEAKPKGTIPPDGGQPTDSGKPKEGDEKPLDEKPKQVVTNGDTKVTVDEKPAADGAKIEKQKDTGGSRPGRGKKMIGLSTMGVGVVLLGTGVYFGLQASSASDEISGVSSNGGTWTPELEQKYADGQSAQTTSFVLYGLGGAALIGGAAVYYMGMKADTDAAEGMAFVPLRGGGGAVVWSGQF
jgi:hypothetical protein